VNWSKTKAFTTIRSTGKGVSIEHTGRAPRGRGFGGDGGEAFGRAGSGDARGPDPWHVDRRRRVELTDTEADVLEEHLRGVGSLE
jgi:hypothetical protein